MSDPRAQVVLDGDVGPLRQKLREATQHWNTFSKDVGSGASQAMAPLEALRGKFLALSAVLAGGAMFGKAIKETADYANQSIQLGKAMGDSASEASVWINVLADAGASTEEFGAASRGLLKNLMADEKALNAMGLATRDSSGQLRSMNAVMLDAIKLVNEYKEGTDRNIAARQIFGKSVDASSTILKINTETVAENRELMEQLGLVVGQNQVDNYKRFDDAMDKSELVMKAFATTIGNALMPVITKLGEWFVSVGPAAVTVIRGAIGGLVTVFWGLKNAITIVWEALNALVITVAEPLRALAAAFYKLIKGDFKGAQEELMNWPSRIGEAWSTAFDKMVESSAEAKERITQLFLDGPAAPGPKRGGRSATVTPKEEKPAPSFMKYYELALAEEKRLASERDATHEYSKEQELAFWQTLLDYAKLSADDRVAVQRKTAQLEVEIRRKTAEDQKAVAEELARNAEQLELGALEAKRTAAAAAVTLGLMTQEQFLQLELDYEAKRYEIQRQAIVDRIQLLANDPTSSPAERARLNSQLLELEQQYQQRRTQALAALGEKKNGPGTAVAEGFGNAFADEFEKTLLRAQSWQQGMANIFRETGMIFLREVVTKPLASFIANQAKMLAIRLGFMSQEEAAQVVSSTKVVGVKTSEAVGVVTANAVEAGSGAAASQASIPYAGPILALAALAAVFAAVMAMTGRLRSARGGYDIPSGVNPMTQLHEEEMVLPAKFANVIRGIADGRASSGRPAAAPTLELKGVSAGDFFLASRRDLKQVFERMRRDGALSGVPV